MRTCVLTGASGFLGSYLLKEITKSFHVRIIERKSILDPNLVENLNLEVFKGDISKKETLKDAFSGVDYCFHLAAKVGSWPKQMDPYIKVNIDGTKNVFESAMENNIEKVIYVSSYFALGPTDMEPVDETWDEETKFKHPYINTKYSAGKVVENFVRNNQTETEIITVNPTIIFGAGINNPVSATLHDFLNKRLIGLPYGGNKKMNFVSPEAVVKGIVQAMEKGNPGEKYILGGENITFREFLMKFGVCLGYKPPRSFPLSLSKIYAKTLEITPLYTPKFTVADIMVPTKHWVYSSKKAINELNYQPGQIGVENYFHYLIEKENSPIHSKIREKIRDYLKSK